MLVTACSVLDNCALCLDTCDLRKIGFYFSTQFYQNRCVLSELLFVISSFLTGEMILHHVFIVKVPISISVISQNNPLSLTYFFLANSGIMKLNNSTYS